MAGILATMAAGAAAAQTSPQWEVYGQLNFGVMTIDNGGGRETYFAENPLVPSRIGLRLTMPAGADGTLRYVLETGFGFTTLAQVTPQESGFDVDFDRTSLRRFEVIYDSHSFGRVSFGQGSMASDGASGVDLSGTGVAHGPAIGDLGGGTDFLRADGTLSGLRVGDVFDDLDGPRRFRLRYDTPDWNGLRVGAAYGREILQNGNDSDYRDIGLSFAREAGDLRLELAASYEWIGNREERALASASVLHRPTGLNVRYATGANRIGEGRYSYVKLGVLRDLVALGPTAVSVEYYDGRDLGIVGSHARAFGIGVVQKVEKVRLDLVATLRRYQLSSPGVQYRDVDVAMIGARWQF